VPPSNRIDKSISIRTSTLAASVPSLLAIAVVVAIVAVAVLRTSVVPARFRIVPSDPTAGTPRRTAKETSTRRAPIYIDGGDGDGKDHKGNSEKKTSLDLYPGRLEAPRRMASPAFSGAAAAFFVATTKQAQLSSTAFG